MNATSHSPRALSSTADAFLVPDSDELGAQVQRQGARKVDGDARRLAVLQHERGIAVRSATRTPFVTSSRDGSGAGGVTHAATRAAASTIRAGASPAVLRHRARRAQNAGLNRNASVYSSIRGV